VCERNGAWSLRLSWAVALGAWLVLGSARPAFAAGITSLVEWDAPEGCAGALEVHARSSRLLGYEPDTLGKLSRIRGSVVRTATGYRLVLEAFEHARRSSRLFEAASCDDLVDTAALAIALAIAPEQAAGITPPAGQAEGAANAAAGTPEPPPGAGSADALSSAPSSSGGAAAAGSGLPSLRGFAAADVLVESGALPRPSPGVAVRAGVLLGALSLGAQGALFGAQTLDVAPDQNVEFELLAAGVRGCWRLRETPPRLNACAGAEAGRYRGIGLGLTPARRVRDLWLAAGAALDAEWPLGPALAVELRAEPMLPLLRKQYTVNGRDDVHAPDVVSARLYLGLILTGG
jgi:hypothetical protein